MHKRLFLCFLFLSCLLKLEAQYNLIQYEFTNKSTTNRTSLYTQFLLFNDERLYYLEPFTIFSDYPELEAKLNDAKSSTVLVALYRNFDSETWMGVGRLLKDYKVYLDAVPMIDWEITPEEKEMLNFNCRKAIGKFRGRVYEAWFTEEIPYSVGPWKFFGLPGAILQIEDLDHYFSFSAVQVRLGNQNSIPSFVDQFFKRTADDAIPYSKFIPLQNKEYMDIISREIASLPKEVMQGGKISNEPRKFLIEKSFEWEVVPSSLQDLKLPHPAK